MRRQYKSYRRIGSVHTLSTVLHHLLCRLSLFHAINVHWIVVTQKSLMFHCSFFAGVTADTLTIYNEWKLSSYAANLLMSFVLPLNTICRKKLNTIIISHCKYMKQSGKRWHRFLTCLLFIDFKKYKQISI